MYASAPAFVDL